MAAKLYCGWQKDSQLLNSQSTILLPLPLFVPVSPLLRYSYKKMGGTLPHAACLPARQDVWALPERFLPKLLRSVRALCGLCVKSFSAFRSELLTFDLKLDLRAFAAPSGREVHLSFTNRIWGL